MIADAQVSNTPRSPEGAPDSLRIGEAASICGITTRTLRYWHEIGLLTPSGMSEGGERMYSQSDVARAARIRELQDLLGFSLSEIRVVLDTDDLLEKLKTAYKASSRPVRQYELISDAILANDKLLARLDDTLQRVQRFRDERADKAKRLRVRARELRTSLEGEILPIVTSPGAEDR